MDNILLGKVYGDGYMVIDRINHPYVSGRFIEEGDHQIPFEKYLLRFADGRPEGFIYGTTFHSWDSFDELI